LGGPDQNTGVISQAAEGRVNAADQKELRELGEAIAAALKLPIAQYGHDAERDSIASGRSAWVRGAVSNLGVSPLSAVIKNLREIPADMPVTYPVADFLDAQ
ncbi:MAG: hypothetical protein ACYCPF_13295, partial [Streptosporangiaceae bacterium]